MSRWFALITGFLLVVGLAGLIAPVPSEAHQSGCHAQHSCLSDTGSYVCGDTGNYSACPGMTPNQVPVVSASGVGSLEVGATLTCSGGSWSANVVSRAYQWLRDGVGDPNQTAPVYVLTEADVSVAVACQVQATDGRGQSATAASNPITLTPPPPLTALSPPLVNTAGLPVRVGSPLTCTPATWSVATTSISYQWLRDGVAVGGATTAPYTVTTEDLGATLSCQLAAKGSRGQDGLATSAGVVAAPPPTPTTPPLRQRHVLAFDLPCGATPASACTARAGMVVRFGGTAEVPSSPDETVTVEFQQRINGSWTTRRTSETAVRKNRFLVLFRLPRKASGVWRARATLTASKRDGNALTSYRYERATYRGPAK